MPTWSKILVEVIKDGALDHVKLQSMRLDFLKQINSMTGRNVISYYSGWMYRNTEDVAINDKDMNAFMEAVSGMDKTKGLDLILHTPGGDIAATEHIINYLHSIFNGNIRAIIPQMAMSAGSMISVSCKEIVMGKQSCLGPFDPQFNGVACQSVLKEFEKAKDDIRTCPESLGLWQVIISQYNPTFILACEQAIELADELADKILKRSEYSDETKDNIKRIFNNNTESKTHSRHFSKEKARDAGLNIVDLEDNNEFQDLILSLHHSCIITLEHTTIVKMVENQLEGRYIRAITPSKQNQ
jgi:hypothetical protein